MTRDAQEILKDALALPAEERAELVDSLLESLETEPDPDVEEAWRKEVLRRSAEVDAGRMKTYPWPEVRARPYALAAAARVLAPASLRRLQSGSAGGLMTTRTNPGGRR